VIKKKKFIKVIFLNIIFLMFFFNIANSSTNAKIVFKINNEIVTTFDINKEYRYLLALNPKLRTLEKKQIIEISKNSIIREIIKKTELVKFFNFGENSEYMETVVKDFYEGLNIKSKSEFIKYLKPYDLSIEDVTEKLEIESIWNEFIFKKYNSQIEIDEDGIKKIVKKKISSNQNNEVSYSLSQILFTANTTEELSNKITLIKKSIKDIGFENTASTFSTSASTSNGGSIGWVKESQLSENIQFALKDLDIGEITAPMNIPGGAIIIKVQDKRLEKIDLNFENEFNMLFNAERNRQLNQFSLIYFNKIKQNANIDE
jgi:peptidyl-prolyl cis-trans isomerase SurA